MSNRKNKKIIEEWAKRYVLERNIRFCVYGKKGRREEKNSMLYKLREFRRGSFFIWLTVVLLSMVIIYLDMNRGQRIYKVFHTKEVKVRDIEIRNGKKYILSEDIYIDCADINADFEVGDSIKITGNLQETLFLENRGYGLYLKSRGYSYLMKAKEIRKTHNNPNKKRGIFFLREKIKQKIDHLYSYHKKMVRALILADREFLSKEDRQMLSKTGISHIISISGFHIILLATIFYQGLFFLSMRERYIASAGITFLYVLLTGANSPCVRAYIFYITYIASIFLGRRYDLFSIGFLLSAVYMAINPYSIFNAGFCLSFLAVFSIGMFYPILYALAKKYVKVDWLETILSLICVTISAQILTLPYVAYNFGIVSIVTVLANMVAVPLISVVYPFMLLSIVCYNIFFLSDVLVNIVNFIFDIFYISNQWFLSLPYAYIEIQNKNVYIFLGYYIGVFLFYHLYIQAKLNTSQIENLCFTQERGE